MVERFLGDKIALHVGDCREVLATLAENSLDACVTDPPYHLTSIVQRFGKPAGNSTKGYGSGFDMTASGTGGAMARLSRGFMGKVWDGGDISFDSETWAAVYRVLKPGAHLIAMGGTRTYHRLACAIEDASFEIRDTVSWLYGSGFPKSHDVSKGIDKSRAGLVFNQIRKHLATCIKQTGITHATIKTHLGYPSDSGVVSHWVGNSQPGVPTWHDWEMMKALLPLGSDFDEFIRTADREKIGEGFSGIATAFGDDEWSQSPGEQFDITKPSTVQAREWEGWGTALKPAMELCVLARKPLSEGTVAANVLRWSTGALNIDGCRVGSDAVSTHSRGSNGAFPKRPTETTPEESGRKADQRNGLDYSERLGRWPANVVHDGSDEVVAAFPETGLSAGGGMKDLQNGKLFGGSTNPNITDHCGFGDSGSAARFFYTSKADADDRLGSKHPTVKPLDLMQWLIRLVTPKNGTVLDCFAGTGTTGEAAWREGMRAVLIEAEAEYQADIRRRMALALAGPDERQRESIKARNLPRDDGPLFGGPDQLAPLEEPAVDYDGNDDFARSYDECLREIRERKTAGGSGWVPREREENECGPLFAWKAQEAAE